MKFVKMASMDCETSNEAVLDDSSEVVIIAENFSVDRPRKNESGVWKWFTKLSKDESMCSVCQKKISRKGASTTALRRHIQQQHAAIYKISGALTCTANKSTTNKEGEIEAVMLEADSARAKNITDAIARMMVLDCQPFSIVSDTGFKNLIKILEPTYSIPCRTRFSDNIIPNLYDSERKRIEEIIMQDMETVSEISER